MVVAAVIAITIMRILTTVQQEVKKGMNVYVLTIRDGFA
jgi:hypothetical protein